jgi:iron(II)-dependent oxidoreductase
MATNLSALDDVRRRLLAARERTLQLVAPLSGEALKMQHSPLMSPILWDLDHIAEFEELWLVRKLEDAADAGLRREYDAMRTPRSRRGELRLPDRAAVERRMEEVRSVVLQRLGRGVPDDGHPLLHDGFVYEMVRQHEAQHQETMLQTITLMRSEQYRPAALRDRRAAGASIPGEMVRVSGGEFDMGAEPGAFSYDNEQPRHRVRVDSFEIGRYPVTNGEYAEFMAAGGYSEPRLWSDEGWTWRTEAGLHAPEYWVPLDGDDRPTALDAAEITRDHGLDGWVRRTSLGEEQIRPLDPVVHVCLHEARAYAAFRGARLPTEAEWEKAAAWDPDTGESRPFPWGREPADVERANLDQLGFGVAPVGSYAEGQSAVGCHQMLGDVWEWTSTPFDGYPGFRAFPYTEYSEVFFGDEYRVLRGCSWATVLCVAGSTFRNWDYPIRRQIFSGIRLAKDV